MSLKLLSMVCAATEEQVGFNVNKYVSEATKDYIIEKSVTDSAGNTEFNFSQHERLYLFGMKKLEYGCAVWSRKVEIKDRQEINLTSENAEMGIF